MSFQWVEINSKEELKPFYLGLLDKIRKVAREHGYAIGPHGSLERDFDLMAVAWREDFSDKNVLAEAIHMAACNLKQTKYEWEQKPNGRVATVFPICWVNFENPKPSTGHIDLSVMTGVKSE